MKGNRSALRVDRTVAEAPRCAAAWFVTLDAGAVDRDTDCEFAEWIGDDLGREAEFARCEAAACLAGRLRSDPEMRWAYEEMEPVLAGAALARRLVPPRRWLSARHALAATAASIVVVMLAAYVFSILRTESFLVASRSPPEALGATPAPEDDRLEGEASLPSTAPRSQTLEDLLERVRSGPEPAHFDRFPLDALVVHALVVVQEPRSPRSRVVVEMPDGAAGYAEVGDYLGEEDLRITEITATAVVLEDGMRIALESPGAQ